MEQNGPLMTQFHSQNDHFEDVLEVMGDVTAVTAPAASGRQLDLPTYLCPLAASGRKTYLPTF